MYTNHLTRREIERQQARQRAARRDVVAAWCAKVIGVSLVAACLWRAVWELGPWLRRIAR